MDVKQTIEGVHAISGGKPMLGVLKLSDYHIIFSALPPSGSDPAARTRESFIAFQLIAHCVFRPTSSTSAISSSIRVRCRDFSFLTFNFPDDKSAREAFEFIRARTCRLGTIENLYAFKYRPSRLEEGLNGWALYDPREEFRRQGISAKSKDLGWRISEINKDYTFSPTYPALLVVPSSISDNVLKYAGNHRSRARIPVLTYLHPVNNCVITRSSQPRVGLRLNRSIQDERLVGACFSATIPDQGAGGTADAGGSTSETDLISLDFPGPEATDADVASDAGVGGIPIEFDVKTGKRVIYGATRQNLIVDARPAINSYAMQAVGLGSENMDYYKFARKAFLNIDNIHVMRESLNKVVEAVKDADISPLPPNRELLVKSAWLKHINGILDGSARIANQVGILHSNILIHCSDGWDRTSQLSALSQIMLDPYFRTIDGFIVLVEKDWLSFGHMFQRRCGFLGHEKWFVVQTDGLAGARIDPGVSEDGSTHRNETLENAMASARRFFKKNLGQDKDESDGEAAEEAPKPANAPVAEDEATKPNEISPVFHQFLDATYQLLRQNPTRFEFNERFLRRLLYHLYACQYGTFLHNNDRQRHEAKAKTRTSSVWNYFLSRRQEFTNPTYDPVVDDNVRGKERLMFPKKGEVRWWHQLYSRSDDEMNSDLDEAASASDRIAAYEASSAAPSPRPGVSGPSPPQTTPGLPTNKSALSSIESAHAALTPEPRRPTSFTRSASDNGSSSTVAVGGNNTPLTVLQGGNSNITSGQSSKAVSGGLGVTHGDVSVTDVGSASDISSGGDFPVRPSDSGSRNGSGSGIPTLGGDANARASDEASWNAQWSGVDRITEQEKKELE